MEQSLLVSVCINDCTRLRYVSTGIIQYVRDGTLGQSGQREVKLLCQFGDHGQFLTNRVDRALVEVSHVFVPKIRCYTVMSC